MSYTNDILYRYSNTARIILTEAFKTYTNKKWLPKIVKWMVPTIENITNLWNVSFLSDVMLLQYEHSFTVISVFIVGMLPGFNFRFGEESTKHSSEKWSEHTRMSFVGWTFLGFVNWTHDCSNSGSFVGNLYVHTKVWYIVFQNITFSPIIHLQNLDMYNSFFSFYFI